MAITKQWKGVCVNLAGGNNKWWRAELHDNGDVITHWGKIVDGAEDSGQSKTFHGAGEGFYDKKIREKQNKSNPDERYTEARVLDGSVGNTQVKISSNQSTSIIDLARKQIDFDHADTFKLIEGLAAANIHNIIAATGGQMKYNKQTGLFETPLGIVTADAISDARNLLSKIGTLVQAKKYDDSSFPSLCNQYLRLIPRDLGRNTRHTPYDLFPSQQSITDQNNTLDDLDASLQMVLSQPVDTSATSAPVPKVFDLKLHEVKSKTEIQRIRDYYNQTRKNMHASSSLDVYRVFYIEIGPHLGPWNANGKKVGNIKELWHGTRVGNVLSIMKGGFVIPPSNASHVTGRMFGNGVYFSDQPTKSLNYAYGCAPGQKGGIEKSTFMFLSDVAMGKEYIPSSWGGNLPMPGYDSTYAMAGRSGVQNNEMIVYKTYQINPRYLVEFR